MPLDLCYTSPPFSGPIPQPTPPSGLRRDWLHQVASLIEALQPRGYWIIAHRSLLFALPHRLPAIVARHVTVRHRDEPYPEVFIFGPPDAFARVTHETPEGATGFDVSKAFAALRVADWGTHVPDRGAVRYLCYEKKAAAKLARCCIEALAEASGLPLEWVPPLKPISINRGDGGQDGLFRLAGRPIWAQVTGGEKPDILPREKWPGFAAAHFFLARGMSSSALKSKSPARRREIFGQAASETADILHVAVGKAAPLASVASAIRGIALEQSRGDGRAPRWLRTVTLHPIEILDPSTGSGSFGDI